MDKSRDKTTLHGKDLEVQYANLLSKSKLMESDFKKEILELKVLYQSEKEKSSSLENSIKNYPFRVSALENLLNKETALRKSLEYALEESSNQQQNEIDKKELERYKQACSQLQVENRSLNQHYISTVNDKNEIQKKLTNYIDFLNRKNDKMKEDHDKIIEEIKFEESQKRVQENKELRKQIEKLHVQVNNKKEMCSRISQKYEDSKDLQLEIAAEADKKESIIQFLKRKNEELLGKSATNRRAPSNVDEAFNELEQLKTENTHYKIKIQSKKDKFYKKIENFVKDQNELIRKVKDLEKTKTKLEQDSHVLHSKIHEQAETIRTLQDKLKDYEDEQNEIVKQTKLSIQPLMIKLKTERDAFKAQLEEVRKSTDTLSGPSLGTSLFEELSSLKNQTAESLEIELSQVSDEKAELERELKDLNSELSRKSIIVLELESEIKDLQSQHVLSNKKLNSELSEKEKIILVLQKTKTELQENIKKGINEIAEKDKIIKQLEDEKTKLKNEIRRLRDIEIELKQKENTILEIQYQKGELQKEIDLLQQLNYEIMHKELSDADIKTPNMSTETSFSGKTIEESERNYEQLHSELFDKESTIIDLNREINEMKKEINKLRRENKDLLSQNNIQTLCPKYTGKNLMAAILELESERDMLKSEIMRLETQLQLSNQEWNCYSNQLYKELVKEHDQKLKILEHKQRRTLKHLESPRSNGSKKKSQLPIKSN